MDFTQKEMNVRLEFVLRLDFVCGLLLLCYLYSAFCDNKRQPVLLPKVENVQIGRDHINITWRKIPSIYQLDRSNNGHSSGFT